MQFEVGRAEGCSPRIADEHWKVLVNGENGDMFGKAMTQHAFGSKIMKKSTLNSTYDQLS